MAGGLPRGVRGLGLPALRRLERSDDDRRRPARDEPRRRRADERRAWLPRRAARSRENLVIRPDTLVRRVLLRDRRVVGWRSRRTGGSTTSARRASCCARGRRRRRASCCVRASARAAAVERLGVDLVVDLPAVGRSCSTIPGSAIFLRPHAPHRVPGPSLHPDGAPLHVEVRAAQRHVHAGRFRRAAPLTGTCRLSASWRASASRTARAPSSYVSPSPTARPRIESRLLLTTPIASAPSRPCSWRWTSRGRRKCASWPASSGLRRASSRDETRLGALARAPLRLELPPVQHGADGRGLGERRGGGDRRTRARAPRRGALGRRRELDADHPERAHEPHRADDGRALRRIDAAGGDVVSGASSRRRVRWSPRRR